jgi:hypothetical protein
MPNRKKLVLVRSSVRGKTELRLTRDPRKGQRIAPDKAAGKILRNPRTRKLVKRPNSLPVCDSRKLAIIDRNLMWSEFVGY